MPLPEIILQGYGVHLFRRVEQSGDLLQYIMILINGKALGGIIMPH